MVTGHYPTSLEEALSLLQEYPGALLINGGTDVMVVKKEARHVIFLNRIEALKEIGEVELKSVAGSSSLEKARSKEVQKKVIRIGAGATYYELLKAPLVPEILKKAISGIASPAIRHVGTIGGNICNASPAGDTIPVLYALDAKVIMASRENERKVIRKEPIESFIKGVRKIALNPNELVLAIEIEVTDYESINHMTYEKVGARKSEAISKASFVGLAETKEGILKQIKIAFGAVSTTAVRDKAIEEALVGQKVEEIKKQKEKIISQYGVLITPIDDQRSTALYRKTVCQNLLRDFLERL